MPEQNAKGLLPSPHDDRDYALSSVAPIIMRYPEVCPAPFDLTVSNQGLVPSCVGHSVAEIKQEKEFRQKISKTFDGDWIYNECKKIDGIPQIKGTYLRTGLEVLRNLGAKPIDSNDPSPYKISLYARNDDGSFEGLKKAIFLYGSALVGFTGSNEGWQGEFVRPPLPNETTWGHAVSLIAYEKDYIIGHNHWGSAWGNNGLFKIPMGYLPFESWAVIVDTVTNLNPQPIATGWVAVSFIQLINGSWKTINNLHVRSGAGTLFPIIKTLPIDTDINLTNKPRISANGYVWAEIII